MEQDLSARGLVQFRRSPSSVFERKRKAPPLKLCNILPKTEHERFGDRAHMKDERRISIKLVVVILHIAGQLAEELHRSSISQCYIAT